MTSAYKKGWIIVNSVPTMVRTWGGWIEDEIKSDIILLFITGNPGITDFYMKFLSTLHFILKIPVWTISHAGNQVPPPDLGLSVPPLRDNKNIYTLQGQVEHKKIFINKYIVPKGKMVYLLGHSVGGKITVELLKDKDISDRTSQAHLMFPTLEHLVDTPNAWLFRHITVPVSPFLIFFSWLFSMMSYRVRYYIVTAFYYIRLHFSMPRGCIHGIVKLIYPEVIQNAIFLAKDEMVHIKDLDQETLLSNKKKIKIYYGQKDGWTEPHHFDNMRQRLPEMDSQLLDSKFQHIFTFKTSCEMAELICKEINDLTRVGSVST